jgi:hypothetical protein
VVSPRSGTVHRRAGAAEELQSADDPSGARGVADYTLDEADPGASLRTQVSRGVRWGVIASVAGLGAYLVTARMLWADDLRDQFAFARLVVNGRVRQ